MSIGQRRRVQLGLGLTLVLSLIGGAATAAAPNTVRVSVGYDGTEANGWSVSAPAISADGRFVVFDSVADNLVPEDTNNFMDIFVYDRATGGIERISLAHDGGEADGDSRQPAISADGGLIAFASAATNLVSADTNNAEDVFVYDRATGIVERVSVAGGHPGVQAHGPSDSPAISADGRYVAFVSLANDLVQGDGNGAVTDVFVRDRLGRQTERVNLSTLGTEANGSSSGRPSISGDGRYVAFSSIASNLVTGDLNVSEDIFVRDRFGSMTLRVSVAADGGDANGLSENPVISADGTTVAFASAATNLVPELPGEPTTAKQVYRYDLIDQATARVTSGPTGAPGGGPSWLPALSADGRYLAFVSEARNLVVTDSKGIAQVYLYDAQAGTTEMVSVSPLAEAGNGYSAFPAVSDDGRFIAFLSSATNLLAVADTQDFDDIFVRDRGGPDLPPPPGPPAPTLSGGGGGASDLLWLGVLLGFIGLRGARRRDPMA